MLIRSQFLCMQTSSFRGIRNCTLVLQKLTKTGKLIILRKKFIHSTKYNLYVSYFSENAKAFIPFARLDSAPFFLWGDVHSVNGSVLSMSFSSIVWNG